MTKLKELAGSISESPATQNTATLVFLYLLTHICREKLSEFRGLSATVISTLPASAGLGSSAAFSVSLAAGFLSLIGEVSPNQRHNDPLQQRATVESERGSAKVELPMSVMQRLDNLGIGVSGSVCTGWSASEMEVINEWGLKAEKLIHGTPSGIDNSVSTFGGAIRFCSGQINHIQRMPKVRILLVNTKVSRSTKKMVAGVRELRDRYPSVVGPILDSVEAIVEKAESLLHQLAQQLSHTQPQPNTETIHAGLQVSKILATFVSDIWKGRYSIFVNFQLRKFYLRKVLAKALISNFCS
jgi:mevalonate kinase